MNRFDYVEYDAESVKQQTMLKEGFIELERLVDVLPKGRAQALVYTKLEEAYMWVGKAIRDDQLVRNGG
jgi:hypothetical protein